MKLTYTLQDLPTVANKVLSTVNTKTLLFYGDMGVGKTTLIQYLAKELGISESLSSPTFSIVNEHELPNDLLYHFDCFRIESEDEAMDIGIEEYLDAGHWSFIEWPDRIERLLPTETTRIELTKNQNGSRTLHILPMN